MIDTKFAVQIQVNANDLFDEQRKEYILRNLREQAVRKLTEQITDGNFYTVRLVQSIHQNYYDVMLRLSWEVNAVQMRHVEMFEPVHYENMNWKILSGSAIDEIKQRIKNYGYKLRQKLSKKFSRIKNGRYW